MKLHGIWDLHKLLTEQEGTSQVHLNVNHNAREGRGCTWTKLGVLFTLEHFWLTSQPFWQVTIGFPRWQEASSRPSLLPPFLKLYKVTRYNTIRYNTSSFPQVIQCNTIQYLSSCYQAAPPESAPYPWENFPSSQSVSPRILVTVRCVLPIVAQLLVTVVRCILPMIWSRQWNCGIVHQLLVTVHCILLMPWSLVLRYCPQLFVRVRCILPMPVVLLGVGGVLECGARRQTLS